MGMYNLRRMKTSIGINILFSSSTNPQAVLGDIFIRLQHLVHAMGKFLELERKSNLEGTYDLRLHDGSRYEAKLISVPEPTGGACHLVLRPIEQTENAVWEVFRGHKWIRELLLDLSSIHGMEIIIAGMDPVATNLTYQMAKCLMLGRQEGCVILSAPLGYLLESVEKLNPQQVSYTKTKFGHDLVALDWPGWFENLGDVIATNEQSYPWLLPYPWHTNESLYDTSIFSIAGFFGSTPTLVTLFLRITNWVEANHEEMRLAFAPNPYGKSGINILNPLLLEFFDDFQGKNAQPWFEVLKEVAYLPIEKMLLPENLARVTFACDGIVFISHPVVLIQIWLDKEGDTPVLYFSISGNHGQPPGSLVRKLAESFLGAMLLDDGVGSFGVTGFANPASLSWPDSEELAMLFHRESGQLNVQWR